MVVSHQYPVIYKDDIKVNPIFDHDHPNRLPPSFMGTHNELNHEENLNMKPPKFNVVSYQPQCVVRDMTAFVFSLFIVKQCDEMLDLLRNSAIVCCQCLQ